MAERKLGVVVRNYRKAVFWRKHHCKLLSIMFMEFNRVFNGCELPISVKLGDDVAFPHRGLGVVIHPDSEIGDGSSIYQNVTFGGKTGQEGAPKVGKRCIIGAGAVLLGDITIGDNSIVASNAVVLQDVPPNCVVGGVPAKILKENINRDDYNWKGR